MAFETVKAVWFCVEGLREQRDYYSANGNLPGNGELVGRLLHRTGELTPAYCDIAKMLGDNKRARWEFFDALICAASVWDPVSIRKARDDKKKLECLYHEIAETAGKLSTLCLERDHIQDHSSFGADAHFDILEVLEAACHDNHLLDSRGKEEMAQLRYRFDLKYWPSLSAFFGEIAEDAKRAKVVCHNRTTEVVTKSNRSSKDFARAIYDRLMACKDSANAALQRDFRLKDETWAALSNVLVPYEPDDLIDGPT